MLGEGAQASRAKDFLSPWSCLQAVQSSRDTAPMNCHPWMGWALVIQLLLTQPF